MTGKRIFMNQRTEKIITAAAMFLLLTACGADSHPVDLPREPSNETAGEFLEGERLKDGRIRYVSTDGILAYAEQEEKPLQDVPEEAANCLTAFLDALQRSAEESAQYLYSPNEDDIAAHRDSDITLLNYTIERSEKINGGLFAFRLTWEDSGAPGKPYKLWIFVGCVEGRFAVIEDADYILDELRKGLDEKDFVLDEPRMAGSGGNINNASVIPASSMFYTDEEVNEAIDTVLYDFEREWAGCTLTEIRYIGDNAAESFGNLAQQHDSGTAIMLTSSFDVDSSGGDGSLNPNYTYEDWKWILVKRDYGWKHVDHEAGPASLTKNEAKTIEGYAVNTAGQTYGSAFFARTHEERPDLISAVGSHGTVGYIYSSDLDAGEPTTPSEAFAQQTRIEELIKEYDGEEIIVFRTIPLYAVDGITVLDEYNISFTSVNGI